MALHPFQHHPGIVLLDGPDHFFRRFVDARHVLGLHTNGNTARIVLNAVTRQAAGQLNEARTLKKRMAHQPMAKSEGLLQEFAFSSCAVDLHQGHDGFLPARR
jgi:hypothetical protein